MSTFVYTTQKEFDGPWLVDRDALLGLHEVLEAISERFDNNAKKEIEDELSESVEGYSSERQEAIRDELRERIALRLNLRRNVKLTLSNSKYIQDETIEQLLSNPELQEEAPVGVEVEISAANCKARLQLRTGIFGSQRLNISASPETEDSSREAFAGLQQWAVTNQAPLWQRIWRKITSYHWIIWGVLIWLSLQALPSKTEEVELFLDPVTQEILVDGITKAEVPQALELLLRYQIKEAPQEIKRKTPTWFKIIFFGGLSISIILSICPTMVIGIGRNESKLILWRKWTRFVGVTVPSIVFASFIWPYVVEWLQNAL